jgi:hypothetical protein
MWQPLGNQTLLRGLRRFHASGPGGQTQPGQLDDPAVRIQCYGLDTSEIPRTQARRNIIDEMMVAGAHAGLRQILAKFFRDGRANDTPANQQLNFDMTGGILIIETPTRNDVRIDPFEKSSDGQRNGSPDTTPEFAKIRTYFIGF